MLNPYHEQIGDLAFVYAHAGRFADNGNHIYSISTAIVRPGKSALMYDSPVRYLNFSERERYYSNLTKKELASAPDIKEVKEHTRSFLKGQKFIFAFTVNSNAGDLQDFVNVDRIIDLNFAAEFFLQYLETHSLKRLWEYLFKKSREQISFSAREIVVLSMELVKTICGSDLNDQKYGRARVLRHYLQKSDTLFGEALVHITRNYRNYFGGLFDAFTLPDTEKWQGFLEQVPAVSMPDKQIDPQRKISGHEIKDRYQKLTDSGKGFKLRQSQIEYALTVADALNENKVLCIEAGTGTGKTHGYLVPAMEFLHRNKQRRIAVSTYTKSLQDQIFQKEIAVLKALFKIYEDIPTALLKGKSSYVCAEKLTDLYDERLQGANLLAWLYLLNNVYNYENADTDTIGENVRRYLNTKNFLAGALKTVSANDGCNGKHNRCPAQVVTAKARNSRLIVTNHHKLALIDMEPMLSGLFSNYIIDEANHFEDAVRNAFRIEADSHLMSQSLQYIERRTLQIKPKAAEELERAIDDIIEGVNILKSRIHSLQLALSAINPHIKFYEESILPPDNEKFKNGHIAFHLQEIQEAVSNINGPMEAVLGDDSMQSLNITPGTAKKLRTERRLMNKFAESLGEIEISLRSENSVPTYMLFHRNFILIASPIELGEIIRKSIYPDKDCIVYTAATLCEKQRFDCFHEIAGLDTPLFSELDKDVEKPVESIAIPSPFSPGLMKIMVPKEATSGRFDNKALWRRKIAALIPDLVVANKGRTLVLFSSYEDLQFVAAEVTDEITDAGYPVLVQNPGLPTINLCEEFRTVKESVLFGVDTFWYGVDFPGDTLTQVIITRVPFPSPGDPIQMGRRKIFTPGRFWKRTNYLKNIKLRQGIGRLIRSETDRGKVIVVDKRFRIEDYSV